MSDWGNLAQCMVDSDAEALARGRRLRRKALVISLCLEGISLAGLWIWPLFTPGVLPALYRVTPLPPYHGGRGGNTSEQHQMQTPVRRSPSAAVLSFHPQQPSHALRPEADESAPDVGLNAGGGSGFGIGQGPRGLVVPGASSDGVGLEPPRETVDNPPVRQKISEGVMAGALIRRVDPVYPTIARAIHLSGEVRLRAIIATDGSVQHLEILSGSPILARAAEEAVRQWRYRPTRLSGVPVEVETYITVNFVLGSVNR